jgi:hypothetical protein
VVNNSVDVYYVLIVHQVKEKIQITYINVYSVVIINFCGMDNVLIIVPDNIMNSFWPVGRFVPGVRLDVSSVRIVSIIVVLRIIRTIWRLFVILVLKDICGIMGNVLGIVPTGTYANNRRTICTRCS